MQIIIGLDPDEQDNVELQKIINGEPAEEGAFYFRFCICPFCHTVNVNNSDYCSISMLWCLECGARSAINLRSAQRIEKPDMKKNKITLSEDLRSYCIDMKSYNDALFYICDLFYIVSVCSHPLETYKYIQQDEKENREQIIENFLTEYSEMNYFTRDKNHEIFKKYNLFNNLPPCNHEDKDDDCDDCANIQDGDNFLPDESVFLTVNRFNIDDYPCGSKRDTDHAGILVYFKYYDPLDDKIKNAHYSGD